MSRTEHACKIVSVAYYGAGKSIATDLIHEILPAKSAERWPEDIATRVHAHSSLSEATMEAMRGIYSQPIHG